MTAISILVALGLLFALDPGGAVAESGFPELQEMDLAQLTAWGFRTIRRGRSAAAHHRAVAVAKVKTEFIAFR